MDIPRDKSLLWLEGYSQSLTVIAVVTLVTCAVVIITIIDWPYICKILEYLNGWCFRLGGSIFSDWPDRGSIFCIAPHKVQLFLLAL